MTRERAEKDGYEGLTILELVVGQQQSESSRTDFTTVPSFLMGGVVERTGIALVHEGEYILPSPGSEAVISGAELSRNAQVINYYFPVEVQVVGLPTDEHVRACADFVYEELIAATGAECGRSAINS